MYYNTAIYFQKTMNSIVLEESIPTVVMMQLFKDQPSKDVTIKTLDGTLLSAHAAILRVISPKVLKDSLSAQQQAPFQICTPNVSERTWSIILELCYTGCAVLPIGFDIRKFYTTVRNLDIKPIVNYLAMHPQVQNVANCDVPIVAVQVKKEEVIELSDSDDEPSMPQLKQEHCVTVTEPIVNDFTETVSREKETEEDSHIGSHLSKNMTKPQVVQHTAEPMDRPTTSQLEIPRQKQDMRHVCQICNKAFAKSTSLGIHTGQVHGTSRIKQIADLECRLCRKQWSTATAMAGHLQRAHGDGRGYQCRYCSAAFRTSTSLKQHFSKHCEMKDSTTAKSVHDRDLSNVNLNKTPSASKGRYLSNVKFVKSYMKCNKHFVQSVLKQKHCRLKKSTYMYKCNMCQKTFHYYSALYNHKKLCKTNISPDKLKASLGWERKKHKSFILRDSIDLHCTYCRYISTTVAGIGRHLNQNHHILNCFMCKNCCKAFKMYRDFANHVAKCAQNKTSQKSCLNTTNAQVTSMNTAPMSAVPAAAVVVAPTFEEEAEEKEEEDEEEEGDSYFDTDEEDINVFNDDDRDVDDYGEYYATDLSD